MSQGGDVKRTFRVSAKLDAEPSYDLPVARLDVTLSVDNKNRVRTEVVYLGIDGRGPIASSRTLDDASVVVDLNSDGQVAGVEFLVKKAPKQRPELLKFIGSSSEAMLLAFIATTAMDAWARSEKMFSRPWPDKAAIDKDLLAAACT